ncbi:MAG: PAS domain S-box protein [Methanosarcinales archaeon]|nr:PAS domain S-box protein [Methanosarcinales archaeon]
MFEIKRSELISAYASSMGTTSAEELIEGKIRKAHLEEKETYTREEIARLCGELMQDGGLIRILAQNFLVQLEYVAREELEELVQERTGKLTETNEELNIAKQHFQTLFSAMVDPVVIIDSEGIFVEATDNVEEVTGFEKEELLGRSFLETGIVTEESKAMITENLAKQRAGVNVAPCEVEVLTKDGRKLPFEVNAAQITHTEQPADMLIFRDITERKKEEEETRRLATIVEQAAEGIAIIDIEGNIQFANQAWATMHGYESSNELAGKHLSIFHTEEQLKTEVIPFNEVVKQSGHNAGEVAHMRKDGTTFPTMMVVSLLKNKQDKPYGIVGFAQDITDRKRLERELQQAFGKLKASYEELSIPVIQVWGGVLVLPIIGILDRERINRLMETMLAKIVETQSRVVIIDVTGVRSVDTNVASHLINVTKAAKLLGTKCVVTGIKPDAAHTLVGLGVDMSEITTKRSMQEGLKYALKIDGA